MAVKIRLKRMGKIRAPFYRVVVMDSRAKRDGRAIEEIGKYHPTEEPSLIDIDSARAQHWLGLGAQPTEAVAALLKVTGDWQKFKGLDGAAGTLRFAKPKTPKRDLYEAAIAAAGGSTLDTKDGSTTPRKKAVKTAPKVEKLDKAEATSVTEAAAPEAPAAGTVKPAAPAAATTTPEAPATEAASAEAAPSEAAPSEAAPSEAAPSAADPATESATESEAPAAEPAQA